MFNFIGVFLAVVVAQVAKIIYTLVKEKTFNLKKCVSLGGMPSSHSAGAVAIVTIVGMKQGLMTPLFTIALVYAAIIITDAQGVRRAAGKQAEILNTIMDDIYWKHKVGEGKLKELLGHTPIEVVMGMIVGWLVAMLFCNLT